MFSSSTIISGEDEVDVILTSVLLVVTVTVSASEDGIATVVLPLVLDDTR